MSGFWAKMGSKKGLFLSLPDPEKVPPQLGWPKSGVPESGHFWGFGQFGTLFGPQNRPSGWDPQNDPFWPLPGCGGTFSGQEGSQNGLFLDPKMAQNPSKTAYKWLVTVLDHFSPRNAPERGPKMAPFLETPFPIKSEVQNGPF